MPLDFARCTHNGTGGSGALVLAAIAGDAQPTDLLGTSGSATLDYVIIEYTDSTKAVRSQIERGRSALTLSTNSMARNPLSTWVAGTGSNRNNPSALTFGNTAANIDIIFPASEASLRPALPGVMANSGIISDSYALANNRIALDSNAGGVALTAGRRVYIPVEYDYGKPITTIAVYASAVTTTGNVRISVYDWGNDGGPGNLLKEFTTATQASITVAAGVKSVTPATPFWLPPGRYFFMLQADAAVQLLFANPSTNMGAGVINSRDTMFVYKDATYGAAPSTGESVATMGGAASRTSGGQPLIYVK